MSTATLWDIITKIESNCNSHAIRFEPRVFANVMSPTWGGYEVIRNIKKANPWASDATVKMIYSTSWGAAQIMGFNIYAQGFLGDIAYFLGSDSAQRAAFHDFVTKKNIDMSPAQLAHFPGERIRFAATYNGNSSEYAPLIAKAMREFGFTVVGD